MTHDRKRFQLKSRSAIVHCPGRQAGGQPTSQPTNPLMTFFLSRITFDGKVRRACDFNELMLNVCFGPGY